MTNIVIEQLYMFRALYMFKIFSCDSKGSEILLKS